MSNDSVEIRYAVSQITHERIKKLSKIWNVDKATVVEMAIYNSFENLEAFGPVTQALKRIEEKLDIAIDWME